MQPNDKEFEGVKVLIVEDNPINQIVTKENLEHLGCFVDVASSGDNALQAFPKKKYDFVFMDIQMPNMDGYEVTRKMREHEGNDRHVKIIALTANAMPEDREKCLSSDMDDYIAKPIEPHTLGDMLKKHSS